MKQGIQDIENWLDNQEMELKLNTEDGFESK